MILPQQANGAVAPPAALPPQTPLQMGSPQPAQNPNRFQQWSQLFNNPNSPMAPLIGAWMNKLQHDQNTTQPDRHAAQQARLRARSAPIGQSVDINRTMG